MTNSFNTYAHEYGGRVLPLFLLFLLALFSFKNAGFTAFAMMSAIPLVIIAAYCAFKWKYTAFWGLILINYFIHFLAKNGYLIGGIPMSLYNEGLELLLIGIALLEIRKDQHFGRSLNVMLFGITLWGILCALEVFNDTCGLGINIGGWFSGFRLLVIQLIYFVLIFSIYVDTPDILTKYLRLWAYLSLFSAFWCWKQQYIGFTQAEQNWLNSEGAATHLVNGITRYFSTFNDAANYGCNAAASAVAFFLLALTSKIKKDKILFLITGSAVLWGMFASGTRTAIACFFAGLMVYVVLSKSVKMAVPIILFGLTAFILLVFTNIGQGNSQIRRMRSAFNKNDASANVRDINQATMAKYLRDAPWGIGIGTGSGDVPANNKYVVMSYIAPDSEYIFMWIHTGIVGVTVFAISMLIMFLGGCYVVLFKLKNKRLVGIGAALCCAFAAIQLGAYLNQVLYQYPNGLIFFGGLAIVYVLPYLEADWEKYEQEALERQEEKRRLKLEKKLASRV